MTGPARDPREHLRFVEKFVYRDRTIKIAQRGDTLKLLIYSPDKLLGRYRNDTRRIRKCPGIGQSQNR